MPHELIAWSYISHSSAVVLCRGFGIVK